MTEMYNLVKNHSKECKGENNSLHEFSFEIKFG